MPAISRLNRCISKENGIPLLERPVGETLMELKPGDAIKIVRRKEVHTERQRNWYRGILLKELSDWNGDTVEEWDYRLKSLCNGNELLRKENIYIGGGKEVTRLTISGVGKQNMTAYINNVLSKCVSEGWPVIPPDPDLRSNTLSHMRAGTFKDENVSRTPAR